jgi:hypothetical protein
LKNNLEKVELFLASLENMCYICTVSLLIHSIRKIKWDVKSYYMDDTKESEVNHIVEAESEQEAMDKVRDFYSKKDSEWKKCRRFGHERSPRCYLYESRQSG